ncbi:MAG TPA: SMI1/KNR4 family protein [Abditibacterium sp.]|jgi:cell wall assembly regulator SMI1
MATKHKRVIGTTLEAILRAETEIGRKFPPSFKDWLLENNCLGTEGISIFPVLDDRDVRKTWDSIVKQYDNGQWFPEYFEDENLSAEHLLPFALLDSGDYYCFDYSRQLTDGEVGIVFWSHETAKIQERAFSFSEFVEKVKCGALTD